MKGYFEGFPESFADAKVEAIALERYLLISYLRESWKGAHEFFVALLEEVQFGIKEVLFDYIDLSLIYLLKLASE